MRKYLKPDSELGYVDNHIDIEYLQFSNLRHTVLGFMLGDFDEHGIYVVDDRICNELIAMKKFVIDNIDNTFVCRSVLKLDTHISFLVTLDNDLATLSLAEKINFEANHKANAGTYSNINEYILDQVEVKGDIKKEDIFKRWNIHEDDGNSLDVFNMDDETVSQFFGIVNRFKYLMAANIQFLEKEEELEAVETEYFIQTSEVLKHYPELQQVIQQSISETLKEKQQFIQLDKPNFTKTLNEVLNQSIEANINILQEDQRADFLKEKEQVTNVYNINSRDVMNIDKTDIRVDSAEIELSKNITDKDKLDIQDFVKESNSITRLSVDLLERPAEEIAKAYVQARKSAEERKREEVVAVVTGTSEENSTVNIYNYLSTETNIDDNMGNPTKEEISKRTNESTTTSTVANQPISTGGKKQETSTQKEILNNTKSGTIPAVTNTKTGGAQTKGQAKGSTNNERRQAGTPIVKGGAQERQGDKNTGNVGNNGRSGNQIGYDNEYYYSVNTTSNGSLVSKNGSLVSKIITNNDKGNTSTDGVNKTAEENTTNGNQNSTNGEVSEFFIKIVEDQNTQNIGNGAEIIANTEVDERAVTGFHDRVEDNIAGR